jgi:hypothetical protein
MRMRSLWALPDEPLLCAILPFDQGAKSKRVDGKLLRRCARSQQARYLYLHPVPSPGWLDARVDMQQCMLVQTIPHFVSTVTIAFVS